MSSIGPQIPAHLQQAQSSSSDDEEPGTSHEIGPKIPASLIDQRQPQQDPSAADSEDDEDDYMPALPPGLQPKEEPVASTSSKKVIGPSFPSRGPYEYDSDDDDVGPSPLPPGYSSASETDGVKLFLEQEEKRRKNIEEASKPKALKRDEWMLRPPSSGELLGNLDPTKLTKARQFSRSTAPASSKDNDMTLWTETPAERQQRLADEVMGRKRKVADEAGLTHEEEMAEKKKRKRDEDIRRTVNEHTNKVRGPSMVESHLSSSKSKSQDDDDEKKGIWDHSRDMALGGRLLDDSSRNKMIRDSRGLGDRFSSGKGGSFM